MVRSFMARGRLAVIVWRCAWFVVVASVLVTAGIFYFPDAVPAEQSSAVPFTFDAVQQLARERAKRAYVTPRDVLPPGLAKLTYDQYRDIRYRADRALWRDEAMFEVQLFHLGFNFKRAVNINEVTDTTVRPLNYAPTLFDFGRNKPPAKLPADLGFAGFRIHFPLNKPAYKDELAVFLGASYFRILGRTQVYGLSARGLAIDTAAPSGEEFPYFTDFWLVRPKPTDRTLTVYALLDSPSLTGAYKFEIYPGDMTRIKVTSEINSRKAVAKLGVAPLTSMFLYGESGRTAEQFTDFRPEVHDSDGLMLQTGSDEWLFRPLNNPKTLRVNQFIDEHPRGFGLVQRDRQFANYQDLEASYHSRPSVWVQPIGDWGKGAVELVEIPSDEEIHDNIVAYWVSGAPLAAGRSVTYSYWLNSFAKSAVWPPAGQAIATRVGSARVAGSREEVPPNMRRVIIDFAGGTLPGLDESQPIEAQVVARGGKISDLTVRRIPANGAWRVAFRVRSSGEQPVDLRCFLSLYGEALTETWTDALSL
jgi:glucans biosynthesis protein